MDLQNTHKAAQRAMRCLGGTAYKVYKKVPGSFLILGAKNMSVATAVDVLKAISPNEHEYLVGPAMPSRHNMEQLDELFTTFQEAGKRFVWVSARTTSKHTDVVCVWNPDNSTVSVRITVHHSLYWWFWWSTLTYWRTRFADWQDRRIKKRLGLG